MLVAVLGPTASAKSEVALAVAERIGARLLSVDSMQVYRGMDIGTAKPTLDERRRIPHGMIDLVCPEHEFTVAEFQRVARAFIDDLPARPVVIAGGSGLHFRAVVDPLTFAPSDPVLRGELESQPTEALVAELVGADPDAGAHVDLANRRRVVRAVEVWRLTGRTPTRRATGAEASDVAAYRPKLAFRAVAFDPGEQIRERIERRVAAMRAAGLLEEVASLAGRLGRTSGQAVGYKELLPVVSGEVPADVGFAAVADATMRLARRQRTFFRRDPRISWLEWSDDPAVRLERCLTGLELPR